MKELRVDFSRIYHPHIICFETTSSYDDNIFLVSENFLSKQISMFSIQKQYFNLNYMLNAKQFKIEVI